MSREFRGQSRFKIATSSYEVSWLESWQDYVEKIEHWVAQAVDQEAELLVFPEYHSMELASLFPAAVYQCLDAQLHQLQSLHSAFVDLYRGLAERQQVYIQAGSFPVLLDTETANDGHRFVNRAYLFHPDGHIDWQDKLKMTRFEKETWGIHAGEALKVFETRFGRVAINICYDSEFPLIARQQVEAGANLILVPSCTDTLAGFYRVQIGCRGRALENQCYVAQSCTVGDALWSPAIDENRGAAAVYTPVDRGFPDDGVLAMGHLNEPGWQFAELDLAQISWVRENGQVFNYRDWVSLPT